jgi:thiamine-phosphate pyrophosphorylase
MHQRLRGLYAIVDVDALERLGRSPLAFAEQVLLARPAAIQLRDKRGGARRTLDLLRATASLAARAGVPLFANDRPDLALLAGVDGVHVGQDDVPVELVHALAARHGKALRVGLSTHNAAQVKEALSRGSPALDYLAVGPIFPTTNKDNPDPALGIEGLRELVQIARIQRPGLSIVAIGGISLDNAGRVGAIADAAAVIGGLLTTDLEAARARAEALHAAIAGGTA